MATQQSWVFGHGLNVENPETGEFRRSTLYSSLTLARNESNWLLAAVPAPTGSPNWQVTAILVRYHFPGLGRIDSVGIRDGERPVFGRSDLNVVATPNAGWEMLRLPLDAPAPFEYGLGVGVHVLHSVAEYESGINPMEIRIVGVGVEFTD
jgi:hypothetical protein